MIDNDPTSIEDLLEDENKRKGIPFLSIKATFYSADINGIKNSSELVNRSLQKLLENKDDVRVEVSMSIDDREILKNIQISKEALLKRQTDIYQEGHHVLNGLLEDKLLDMLEFIHTNSIEEISKNVQDKLNKLYDLDKQITVVSIDTNVRITNEFPNSFNIQ